MRYVVALLVGVAVLGAFQVNLAPAKTEYVQKNLTEKLLSPSRQTLATVRGEALVKEYVKSGQPDTLYYDDGLPHHGYTPGTGLLGAVRFTAPSVFELRAVYMWIYNVGAVDTTTMRVFVSDTTDTMPEHLLGGPWEVEIPPGFWIIQFDIPEAEYITFNPGEDFYIIIGSQIAWGINTLVFDNGTTTYRSWIFWPSAGEWAISDDGDLMLRAGGEATPYVDGVAYCAYMSEGTFFFDVGATISPFGTIINRGSDTLTDWTLYFSIRDTLGNVFYTSSVSSAEYGVLLPGDTLNLQAPTTWTMPDAGYYILVDSLVSSEDLDLTNNVAMVELRGIDGSTGGWYLYTDLSAEACFNWVPGNMWIMGYKPVSYPARLDSATFAWGVSPDTVATDVPFYIMWGMEYPETVLGAYLIDTILDGYLTTVYWPDTEAFVIDSGMYFVGYPFTEDANGNSVCLFQDATPPIAGSNWCVDYVSFEAELDTSGTYTIYYSNSGDWYMWLYLSYAQPYVCGDMNGDGYVTPDDFVYLGNYLFFGGPAPISNWAADVNGDGYVTPDDFVYLGNYLFFGGPAPSCP